MPIETKSPPHEEISIASPPLPALAAGTRSAGPSWPSLRCGPRTEPDPRCHPRQLQVTADQRGVQLTCRDKGGPYLTPATKDYVIEVRQTLITLAAASLTLRANPTGGALNLAILPAFGMYWRAPRLAIFARAHPNPESIRLDHTVLGIQFRPALTKVFAISMTLRMMATLAGLPTARRCSCLAFRFGLNRIVTRAGR